MIIIFLVGFLFSFVGAVGEDVMNIITFVVSEDNLGKNGTDGEGFLVSSLGKSKSYLDRCINGDGKIEEEIGLDIKKINSFENISNSKTKIDQIKEQFRSIKNNYFIYNQYKTFFDRREDLTSEELSLIPKDKSFKDEDHKNFLNFHQILRDMNEEINNSGDILHKDESWSIRGFDETMLNHGDEMGDI